ncbi:MAG: hypothetical protein IKH90_01950 [Ruminococcus sp.]|nr:hypothetical protein [Ruminococcus sp.]
MVTDTFMEQVVKKTPTKRDKTLEVMVKFCAFMLAMALIFTCMAYYVKAAPLAVFLGIMAIYLSFRLTKKLDVEYEYIFTNGELDVDKIIAKSKRKRLCTVKFNSISAFGLWDDDMAVDEDSTIVLASDNSEGAKEYFVDFKYKDYGDTTLFFSPNSELMELIIPYLPREIRKEFSSTYKPDTDDSEE